MTDAGLEHVDSLRRIVRRDKQPVRTKLLQYKPGYGWLERIILVEENRTRALPQDIRHFQRVSTRAFPDPTAPKPETLLDSDIASPDNWALPKEIPKARRVAVSKIEA